MGAREGVISSVALEVLKRINEGSTVNQQNKIVGRRTVTASQKEFRVTKRKERQDLGNQKTPKCW